MKEKEVKPMQRDPNMTGWHRPVCVKCEVDMRPEMNGVGLLDMADYGPVKVWDADLWKCPKCGIEVVAGFGSNAIVHHFEDTFQWRLDSYENNARLIRSHFFKEG